MNAYSVQSNRSSTAAVGLTNVEEKEYDSDVEIIQDNPTEELRLLVETEEAVANIVNTGTDSGQNVKVPSKPSTSTTLQPQVEQGLCFPQVPLFDLTEDNSLETNKESNSNSSSAAEKKIKIRVTKAESNFRRNFYKSNPAVSTFRIHCTACDIHLGTAGCNAHNIKLHSTLRVLVCSTCASRISRSVNIPTQHSMCCWCYIPCNSGDYSVQCYACPSVFCQECMKRNLGNESNERVKVSSTWTCFFCEPRQIWPHRVIANAVMKHLEQIKGIQHLNPADYMTDWTDCCKSNDQDTVTSVEKPPSTPTAPHIGIAMPRCRPPPPLMLMPQEANSIQESPSNLKTVMDYSGQMRKVFIQDSNNYQNSVQNLQTFVDKSGQMRQVIVQDKSTCPQFTTQPTKSVIVQSNRGPVQIDRNVMQQMLLQGNRSINPDGMKQMVLQGNQSVTLNTGPQVIHNVYPNRRIVLLAQEPQGQQVSPMRPAAQQYQISGTQMSLHQDKNMAINQIQVSTPEQNLANGNLNQIKIVHAGTLIDKSKNPLFPDKSKQNIRSLNAIGITSPARLYNAAVSNLPQISLANNVTRKVNLLTGASLLRPEIASNQKEIVGRRLLIQNEPVESTSKNPNSISLRSLLTNRPPHHNSSVNVNLESLNNEKSSNQLENINLESVVQSQNSLTNHRNSSTILENELCKETETNILSDPLSVVETAPEDDVIFVEEDPLATEKDNLVINFVDVETNAVEEINITNILKSNNCKLNPVATSFQPVEKDSTIHKPPLPRIKIKAIEELVDVSVIKMAKTSDNCLADVERKSAIEHPEVQASSGVSIEREKSVETSEYMDVSEDQQSIDMKSLKQAMDGIQRVLVSAIRSVRSNRSTVKSYNNLKCKSSEAVKHIAMIQNDLKMCSRQLNLIQSNIYEYYKDVPGVLEPFEVDENRTEKSNTESFTASDPITEQGNRNVIKKEIECMNSISNTNSTQSNLSIPSTSSAQPNYIDNYTKFLSHKSNSNKNKSNDMNQYNSTSSQENMPKSSSNKRKRKQIHQVNDTNSYESVTLSKRPKLDFDLSNKRTISGSPVVTEDELKVRDKTNLLSSETTHKASKHKVSEKTTQSKYAKLLKKHKIRECYVRLYQLDPEFIRIYEML